MQVKRIAAYTHLSSTIYEQLFPYPLAFNAPDGSVPIGIPGKSLVLKNLNHHLEPGSEDSLTIG